jgi:hypothetical protein
MGLLSGLFSGRESFSNEKKETTGFKVGMSQLAVFSRISNIFAIDCFLKDETDCEYDISELKYGIAIPYQTSNSCITEFGVMLYRYMREYESSAIDCYVKTLLSFTDNKDSFDLIAARVFGNCMFEESFWKSVVDNWLYPLSDGQQKALTNLCNGLDGVSINLKSGCSQSKKLEIDAGISDTQMRNACKGASIAVGNLIKLRENKKADFNYKINRVSGYINDENALALNEEYFDAQWYLVARGDKFAVSEGVLTMALLLAMQRDWIGGVRLRSDGMKKDVVLRKTYVSSFEAKRLVVLLSPEIGSMKFKLLQNDDIKSGLQRIIEVAKYGGFMVTDNIK